MTKKQEYLLIILIEKDRGRQRVQTNIYLVIIKLQLLTNAYVDKARTDIAFAPCFCHTS